MMNSKYVFLIVLFLGLFVQSRAQVFRNLKFDQTQHAQLSSSLPIFFSKVQSDLK